MLETAARCEGNAYTDCAAVHTKNSESAMQQRITRDARNQRDTRNQRCSATQQRYAATHTNKWSATQQPYAAVRANKRPATQKRYAATHTISEPQCTQRLPRRDLSSLARAKTSFCCAAFRPERLPVRIFQRDNAYATLVMAVALQQIIDRA